MLKKRLLLGVFILVIIVFLLVLSLQIWPHLPRLVRFLRGERHYPLRGDSEYKWNIAGQRAGFELEEVHTSFLPLKALLYTPQGVYGAGAGGLVSLESGEEKYYTAAQGLPGHNLQALVYHEGSLWIGCGEGGLIKMQGDEFVSYDAPHPLQNVVTSLAVYVDDLFIGTRRGLVRFDGQVWREYGIQSGLPSLDIIAMVADNDGLWLATTQGIVRYNNHLFETLPLPAMPAGCFLPRDLYYDGELLWVATIDGLFVYDGGEWRDETPKMGIMGRHISALAGREKQVFAAGYAGGVVERRGERWVGVSDDKYTEALAFNGYELLLSSSRGLRRLKGGLWETVEMPAGPPGNEITNLYAEGETLWLGTFRSGVARYSQGLWEDRRFFEEPGIFEVNQIISVDGTVYAATTRGLGQLIEDKWHLWGPSLGLEQYRVNGLDYDGNYIWLATADGLVRYDGLNFTRLGMTDGLINERVYAVHWDGDTLWVGTLAGLSAFKGGRWQFYTKEGGQLNNNWVTAICSTDEGVWVGTYGGGVSFFDGGGWDDFAADRDLNNLEINPHALIPFGRGVLAGTLGGGLYYITKEGATKVSHDFPDNNITALAVMGERVWVGSGSGLWSFIWEGTR